VVLFGQIGIAPKEVVVLQWWSMTTIEAVGVEEARSGETGNVAVGSDGESKTVKVDDEELGGDGDGVGKGDGTTEMSLLRDNIRRKGQNAYYYAHVSNWETVQNFGGLPPPVEFDPSQLVQKTLKNVLKRYSWSDEKKSVKIYVPFPEGVSNVEDENVELQWETKSLSLFLKGLNNKDYELCFPELHDEVSDVSHRIKSDSVVVTLKKATEFSWYQLAKK